MSNVMFFGVLNMPYDLAMADDMSRLQFYGRAREAAADIMRLREGLEIAEAWLRRWAVHVGQCEGGDRCTCGLTRIRYDAAIALQPKE